MTAARKLAGRERRRRGAARLRDAALADEHGKALLRGNGRVLYRDGCLRRRSTMDRYPGPTEDLKAKILSLVQPDRVHRDLYIDDEIFALEQEHFFANTWNYVGHDSQMPQPGDYITAEIARPAADRGAPRRRQRARADEPLRAQGLARRQRTERQHRQVLSLPVPRLDLQAPTARCWPSR